MEIIKNTKGRAKGKVSVAKTLASMEPGDLWTVSASIIDYNYLTTACYSISKKLKRVYETSARAELKGKITVKRIS